MSAQSLQLTFSMYGLQPRDAPVPPAVFATNQRLSMARKREIACADKLVSGMMARGSEGRPRDDDAMITTMQLRGRQDGRSSAIPDMTFIRDCKISSVYDSSILASLIPLIGVDVGEPFIFSKIGWRMFALLSPSYSAHAASVFASRAPSLHSSA